jgi:membrane-bound serine protease (ClpP class)
MTDPRTRTWRAFCALSLLIFLTPDLAAAFAPGEPVFHSEPDGAISLLVLGLMLMIAEAVTPSPGILGAIGLVAFGFGAFLLYGAVTPLLIVFIIIGGGLVVLSAVLTIRAYRRRVVTGREAMIGSSATVLEWNGEQGFVHLQGERWQAKGTGSFVPGTAVRVTGIDGLVAIVEPQDQQSKGRP